MALKLRKNKVTQPLCPIGECMTFLGMAWTPNVIWYLSACARRFSELRHDIPGVSAKVLTQRLREMEERGVLIRRVMPTSPPSVEYELTDLGREFLPVIESIMMMGHRLKARTAPAGRAA